MVNRLLPILSALLLFAASQVHALSLGDITLESAAGEPLQARIQLLDVDGLSASDISAMVASATDFQRFDADRIAALDNLNITVEVIDGAPVLRISSPVTIDEPFLSLVLDTRWPAGRMLTEYTVRLESPAFSAQSNQQVSAAPVQSVFEAAATDDAADADVDSVADADAEPSAQPVTAAVADADTAPDSDASRSTSVAPAADGQSAPAQPAPAAAPDDLANASTLTVNAGDTLWELALRARPDDSVTVQQTMLALQRLNPDAFLGNNINRVKRGEVLRVPELNEIRQMAAAEAIAEVTRQNLELRSGTSTVGSEPVTAGPGAATSGTAQGQLRVVTADDESEETADASASAASTQSAEQEIARNDEQLDALEDSMAQREEELDRLDLENTELNSRLAMLQQQITSAQEIIRLRDLELAQLQAQLAEAEAADADPAVATDEDQATTITMAPDAGPVERFFSFLISNTWALLAAAAVLVLLLVLVLVRRNRAALTDEQRAQRDNDDMPLGEDSDDELLFSGVAAAAAAAADESDTDADADNTDDADDDGVTYSASGTVDEGAVDADATDDADQASADAEQDESAPAATSFDEDTIFDDEFALDDTLEVDPEANDTFASPAPDDTAASAPDTSDALDRGNDSDDGPDWGDTDLDLDEEDTGDADDNEAGEFDDRDAALADDDDLSWPDAEPSAVADGGADYDIYDDAADRAATAEPEQGGAPVPEAEPATAPEPEAEPELEPELEPEPEVTDAVDEASDPPVAEKDDDFDDLAFISNEDSFDADDDDDDEEFAFLSDSDEAATKLDLARAYIDMGDSAGAREILAEVVKEGTEAQRRDAEELLERL